MTKKKFIDEEERARELEREAKELRRSLKDFYARADRMQDKLLERWGLVADDEESMTEAENFISDACEAYGCSYEELRNWVLSVGQISYFKDRH